MPGHQGLLQDTLPMRSTLALRLVIATGPLLFCGEGASACTIPWFCEPEPTTYAPMRAPPQDPRFGPVWTSNGWSYPDAQRHADAPSAWPYGAPSARRGMETLEPRLETPIELK